MNKQNDAKLKSLINTVPPGFVVDSQWFKRHGYSRTSQHDYVQQGWLERLAQGVYQRPDPHTALIADWQRIILSMQWLMHYQIHVGGTTALSMAGYTHYLDFGDRPKHVFVYSAKFPGWLERIQANGRFECRNNKLFKTDTLNTTLENDETLTKRPLNTSLVRSDYEIYCSTLERAVLEALDELPEFESFHQLDMVFESLSNLSPRRLMRLLKACQSIKVKRLFFVFADKHDHAWRKHMDHTAIDLGTGDRSFTKGGKLHPVYRITVPAEYVPHHAEDQDGA